jgi:hypothetical protein
MSPAPIEIIALLLVSIAECSFNQGKTRVQDRGGSMQPAFIDA